MSDVQFTSDINLNRNDQTAPVNTGVIVFLITLGVGAVLTVLLAPRGRKKPKTFRDNVQQFLEELSKATTQAMEQLRETIAKLIKQLEKRGK
jgi:gas vesicle protein